MFTNILPGGSPAFVVALIQSGGQPCNPMDPSGELMKVTIAFDCLASATGAGQLVVDPREWLATPCNVNVTWRTSTVCALPPAPNTPLPGTGLSFGWLFLLGFAAAAVLYVGLGTLVKTKLLPNASANLYNNIPQKNMWRELPSLVVDGFKFVTSGGKKTDTAEYEPIDTGRGEKE